MLENSVGSNCTEEEKENFRKEMQAVFEKVSKAKTFGRLKQHVFISFAFLRTKRKN